MGAVCSLGLIDLWVPGGQVEYRKNPNPVQNRKLGLQRSVPPVVAMQLRHWATLTRNVALPRSTFWKVPKSRTRRVESLWCRLPPNENGARRVALHQRHGYPLMKIFAELSLLDLNMAMPGRRIVPHTLVDNEHVRLHTHRLASRHLQHYVMTVDTTRQDVRVLRVELA